MDKRVELVTDEHLDKAIEKMKGAGYTLEASVRSNSGIWKCTFAPPIEVPTAPEPKAKPTPKPTPEPTKTVKAKKKGKK